MAEKIKPDYLVLDDRLPHRKGRHLLRAIRQDQSFLIPILLLTEHCIADDLYANTWVYWGDFFVTVPLGNGELKAFFTRAEETPSTFLWKWSVPWAEDPELLEKYPYLATENPKRHEW